MSLFAQFYSALFEPSPTVRVILCSSCAVHVLYVKNPKLKLLQLNLCTDVEVLPETLTKHYGLTIELLRDVLQAARDGTTSNSHWTLHGIPKVEFYRMLHPFLKKWKVTHSLSKTTIGKIYLSIDAQLQARGSTAYNTYRFIEKLMFSNVPDSAIMSYGTDKSIEKLRAEFKCCTKQVESLDIKLL